MTKFTGVKLQLIVGTCNMNDNEFIAYTKKVFEPYYKRTITDLEAREICDNMNRLLFLLIDLHFAASSNGDVLSFIAHDPN